MRDVTKTKPSHHRPTNQAKAEPKPQWPATFEGGKLATEVKESGLPADVQQRLVREIMDHESTHATCTKTFQRKIRKQVHPKPT